jgi:hypothetical protein
MSKRYIDRSILTRKDLAVEEVFVPEWDAHVRVKALSGRERDAFEASVVGLQGRNTVVKMDNIRAKLVSLCVVDEAGNRIFTDQDVEALGELNAAALDRIFTVAMRLAGLTAQDLEQMRTNFT